MRTASFVETSSSAVRMSSSMVSSSRSSFHFSFLPVFCSLGASFVLTVLKAASFAACSLSRSDFFSR